MAFFAVLLFFLFWITHLFFQSVQLGWASWDVPVEIITIIKNHLLNSYREHTFRCTHLQQKGLNVLTRQTKRFLITNSPAPRNNNKNNNNRTYKKYNKKSQIKIPPYAAGVMLMSKKGCEANVIWITCWSVCCCFYPAPQLR